METILNKESRAVIELMVADGIIAKDIAERYFPELKESEEEKIRKVLLNDFKNNCSEYYCEGVNRDMIIAWLEKQGEQKSIDDLTQQEAMDIAVAKCFEQGEQKPYGQRQECVDCQFNYAGECKGSCAMKRGEQKHVDRVELKFKVGDEIKTSNEESLTVTKIDEKGYWSEDLFICGFDDAAKWKLVEQKPAWSEEDEKVIHCLEYTVKHFYEDKDTVKWCCDWLKSLKDRVQPQPTWKPSEEQMDVLLSEVTAWPKGCPKQIVLESLYNDLKKLKA